MTNITKMSAKVSHNRGFTLIELIVTMSVAAILIGIGVPNFLELIRDNRLATQYNDFLSALNLARSEAINRGTGVTLCKRNTAGTACNNSGNWDDGWFVFADINRDGILDSKDLKFDRNKDGVVDINDAIVRIFPPLTGNNTLRPNTSRNRITFDGQGFARGFQATFKLCDARGAKRAKGLEISANGRARRAIDSARDTDSIVEDGSGTNITCP